jgi:hypothetical protein
VGRITALAAVVAGALLLSRTAGTPRFRELGPGVEFGVLRGEPYCRRGSSDIAVLRLDPNRVRLRVRHFTAMGARTPPTLLEWHRLGGALAVFNAGQYYPDYSYMGILVAGGRFVSRRRHPGYQAALVDGPSDGAGGARVLDLQRDSIDVAGPRWSEVAQSFMLFDRDGRTRVRRSAVVANRTVVGEDADGRLLVLTTEGGYTLYELAGLLRNSPLRLTHAMSMDGGDEAGLCVRVGGFRYASMGKWEPTGEVPNPAHPIVPLPAVVEVHAR